MKPTRALLVLIPFVSGCAVFDVPRTKPSQQLTPWAAQTVRDANNAERERIDKAVRKGSEKSD